MESRSGKGLLGTRPKPESIFLGHYAALDGLLAHSGWSGEEWFRDFAAESIRIGEALGSLRENVAEEMARHQERAGQGISPLNKLHLVLMCQAAAATVADAMQEGDLEPLGASATAKKERRSLLIQSLDRSYGSVSDLEKVAWAAALKQRLAERWRGFNGSSTMKLGQLIAETQSFTPTSRSMIIAGLSDSPAMWRDDSEVAKLKNALPYTPTSAAAPASLLDFNHKPNDLASDVLFYAKGMLCMDTSACLETRFYALGSVHGYDHPLLISRYPNGVFDGTTLLLPMAKVASGIGTPEVFKRATEVMSQAAREALGIEEPVEGGLYRAEPGSLTGILLSCGFLDAAKKLASPLAERERARAGFHFTDVANALREACLEGLGFPQSATQPRSTQRSLDDALREAAWLGRQRKVEDLLQGGADPMSTCGEGVTALMLCAAKGDETMVQFLVSLSEVGARDRHGKSARDYAELQGGPDSAIAKWLDACALSISERAGLLEAAPDAAPALNAAAPRSRL
jgi:hypothetical protein